MLRKPSSANKMASPSYYKDRKDDLQDLKFLNAELPDRINHQSAPIHHHSRRSQFWRKLITGGSFVAATTLLLLTTLPEQSQSHVNYPSDFLLPPLAFSSGDSTTNAKNTFQISIFQDLNFLQNVPGKADDTSSTTVRVVKSVLDGESKPDLVVLNGITPPSEKENDMTAYLDQIVSPMVRRKLTWASTYRGGDHSSQSRKEALFEREKLWLSSRTKKMVDGDEVGVTNYYLPVYAAGCGTLERKRKQEEEEEEEEEEKRAWYQRAWNNMATIANVYRSQPPGETGCETPSLILWFFDSNSSSSSSSSSTRKVYPSVLEWFKTTSASMSAQAGGKTIPSMGFVSHVPTSASSSAPRQGQDQNMSFMEALASTPGFMVLFASGGQDMESASGSTLSGCYKWNVEGLGKSGAGAGTHEYQGQSGQAVMTTTDGNEGGINLCFGKQQGSRQIVIDQEELRGFEIRTHVRLENGEMVGAVTLNATDR